MSVLKSAAPELAQTLTQVFLARNGQPAAAQPKPSVNGSLNLSQQSEVKTEPSLDTVPLPTAYDQVAGQLRGLLERLQVQIRAGLDPNLAVETLLALEANNDPIAHPILNAVEKSSTFESWLTWLRSQVGAGLVIDQQTVTFLTKVFEIVKTLPDYPETEGE